MKRLAVIIFLLVAVCAASAQGRYSGSKKGLIGKIYTDRRSIDGLAGWTFREGSVITPLDDPETIIVDVFQKGATFLASFSIKEDTDSDQLAPETIILIIKNDRK